MMAVFLISTKLFLINYPGHQIHEAIDKSKKKSTQTKLLLGDSVARQLFSNEESDDHFNSLATNQAISMAGQFILLNNYLKEGNEIDTLILLFTPESFQNNLNDELTFHYFIKPFYNKENKPFFTDYLVGQIKKIPFYQLSIIPHIYSTIWAPKFTSIDPKDYSFLSPISVEYLSKIRELSEAYHLVLIIKSPPVSINKKAEVEHMDVSEAKKCGLLNEFQAYFNSVHYFNSSQFVDGTHLKQPELFMSDYEKLIY
jgi:hypothetical protein